jgi:hypothetical protein
MCATARWSVRRWSIPRYGDPAPDRTFKSNYASLTSKRLRSCVPNGRSHDRGGAGSIPFIELRKTRLTEQVLHERDNATTEFDCQPSKCNCNTAADDRIKQYIGECSHATVSDRGARRLIYNHGLVLEMRRDFTS